MIDTTKYNSSDLRRLSTALENLADDLDSGEIIEVDGVLSCTTNKTGENIEVDGVLSCTTNKTEEVKISGSVIFKFKSGKYSEY